MKTADTINSVCNDLGITKAELAKKMGMLPSSLYRKLARESMTFEELQRCLDVLGVDIEFNLRYPDGNVRSSQINYEILLERMQMLETEIEATRKYEEYHRKALKELRTELSNIVGYVEIGKKNGIDLYLNKIQSVLTKMELTINCALGEKDYEEPESEETENFDILRGKRLLIVDDNDLNREIMKEILVEYGLVIEEANNGNDAIEALKNKEPGYYHFVIMDIEMPVMDGYGATLRIRKLPNRIRANVPIIALTANAFDENRIRAKEVGMDDFLAKPINSVRLLRSLIKYL